MGKVQILYVLLSLGYITFYHQDQKMFGPLKLPTQVFSFPGLCLGLAGESRRLRFSDC